MKQEKAYYHLPGLFEFYELYREFLPLYRGHREYFYDWCSIGSIYGAPADCIWGGGRTGFGGHDPREVLALMQEYGISARLTFSNSLLREEHLSDRKCNALCTLFAQSGGVENGVILHSELLLDYLRTHYPQLYLVSSTTKVLTDFRQLRDETAREEFRYVVPDFRLNKAFEQLDSLTQHQKDKVEFLCNECCWVGCRDRKRCYENVSRKNLGEDCPDHICTAPGAGEGYRFSKAMENPSFIGVEDIRRTFLPMGFSNFKIEGRGLGSALVLEFLLYYMKPSIWTVCSTYSERPVLRFESILTKPGGVVIIERQLYPTNCRKEKTIMEALECIKTRRSVRRFTEEPVTPEQVAEVVAAAAYAPSWKNTQIARYILVEDAQKREKIASDCVLDFTYNANTLSHAPALVALTMVTGRSGFERDGSYSSPLEGHWQSFDAGIAAQTFCLAAHALGLGTVIMGIYDPDKVAKVLSVPEGQTVAALIAIGHPAQDPAAPARKSVEELLSVQ